MRCPSCGEIVREGNRFCTKCGHRMEEPPRTEPERTDELETATAPRSNSKFLYAVIALLAMLLLVLTYLVFGGRSPSDPYEPKVNGSDAAIAVRVPAQTSAPEATLAPAEPTPAPTPSPTPSPTPAPVPGEELMTTIDNYLHGFVSDVNNGTYSSLYSSVQSGSPMETEQMEFVQKSREIDREEALLEYQMLSMNRVNDTTCHVTVLEYYEIWQDDDPEHFTMKQQCTYQLNLQPGGGWKVYSFVKYEAFDQMERP